MKTFLQNPDKRLLTFSHWINLLFIYLRNIYMLVSLIYIAFFPYNAAEIAHLSVGSRLVQLCLVAQLRAFRPYEAS